MSRDIVVAKRYAKALFQVAQEKNSISQTEQELKLIVDVVNESVDLQKFLKAPNIDLSAKLDVLNNALSGKLSETVLNTVNLLIQRGRHDLLNAMLEAYVKISGEALGQADASVVSAYPLSQPESELIAQQFGKLVGKKIRVQNVVDKSIIGGIQVRIGDRLYDGSISGKLAHMEKSLKTQAL
ncbi:MULTISPECIES: F0F1 ATP synthase subunit delta [unclassified Paenibacillus]|uniref:F0F1 ATP synthase subunit delta n=1 Tax=unclassified Paenibacillus TaxID=185978 RepID=UPI001C1258D8|nr:MULTISPECIES: F0F1 ATP synthase subunit delta [unclassified Paenibacillus]MBU5441724.1 F0F1 ATP synthase subunit delta [Paenibacillus sp. MSJ-34]CAH0118083.1 ATP synthase subunit delta [Paenibacillus sp. CECT 9249]